MCCRVNARFYLTLALSMCDYDIYVYAGHYYYIVNCSILLVTKFHKRLTTLVPKFLVVIVLKSLVTKVPESLVTIVPKSPVTIVPIGSFANVHKSLVTKVPQHLAKLFAKVHPQKLPNF
jgi:hypothetical protein